MTVEEIHSKGFEFYKAKNFDAALEIVDELKRLDPNYKMAYYLESAVWNRLKNPFKEYQALKKILPFLDTSSAEGRKFAADIFWNVIATCKTLNLWNESVDFYQPRRKTPTMGI